MSASPEGTPAHGDPGDETARRYRYQWTYAAIICCLLLDQSESIQEVFCEHHEDVLIKHLDDQFTGLQVKTRSTDQPAWTTNDEAVRKSFARFVKLERDFPGRFKAFRFLTNHPLAANKNGKDICHVLAEIRAAGSLIGMPASALRFLNAVSKVAGCPIEDTYAALVKAEARDGLPHLKDAEVRLMHALVLNWEDASELPFNRVQGAARSLIDECCRASSLAHEDVLPAYYSATADSNDDDLVARINGKRFGLARVLEALKNGLQGSALLGSNPEGVIEPGGGATQLLLKKLDAGGFSAVSRNSAEDLRDKADYLGIVWTQKYGRDDGLQRWGHVRSIVLSDAARAFEISKDDADCFGLEMLAALRARFKQRRTEGTHLFGCTDEHLEGMAYALTSECTVQWSVSRPWESEQ